MSRQSLKLAFLLVAATALAAPALAETQEEQAYGFGAFAGAAVFCGVPKDDVTVFFDKLLQKVGIDTSTETSPAMQKFTEGVTAGVVEMRDHPQVECASVKKSFSDLKAKLG